MTTRSAFYETYMQSEAWRALRAEKLEEVGYECERCSDGGLLDIHHLTYDRLGNERLEDLLVVCRPCHEKEDKRRAERTAVQAWGRRVAGYARKRWGEDWRYYHTFDEASEALSEWIGQTEDRW